MNPQLQLRDIHLPPEPSWWPPAPGWWLLALLLIVVAVLTARALRRRHRARRRLAALRAEFDAAVVLADPLARVSAISQLLRRAAQLRDPSAATLQGEAWLHFLDAAGQRATPGAEPGMARPFSAGPGRALLDAPYRAQIYAGTVDALIAPARRRFEALVEST